MARTRRTVEKPAIVADNIEREEARAAVPTGETVTVACHLAHPLKFDDVPNGIGGTKTIIFPGINDSLVGRKSGILIGAGKAVAVTIAKKDWQAIKAMHGKEAVFVGVNGFPPCLIEMKDAAEFKARKNEIVSEMRHGLEAKTAESVGVKEATKAGA